MAKKIDRLATLPTSVYRILDAGGRLLYVGIAVEPFLRLDQHWKTKPWWPEVSMVHLEWYANRQAAFDEELRSIRLENPVYNVQGRGGPGQCRPTPEHPEPIREPDHLTWIGGA